MAEASCPIPVVDVSSFSPAGSPAASEEIAQQQQEQSRALHDACVNVGFFYIKGHGVPEQCHQDLFTACKDFFSLPLEEKLALDATKSPMFRGYNSLLTGKHNCTQEDENKRQDVKESFTVGAEGTKSPMHGPNQWPDASLPSFKGRVQAYDAALLAASRRVGHALALALGLDGAYFVDKMQDPVAQLVLLKYEPLPAESKQVGCGAHTDCGFLTLLAQEDGTSGLEVRMADGQWVAGKPIPGTIICNLGDMATFWTGGRYKSTWHRVSNNGNTARYSAPYFCNCDFDTPVAEAAIEGATPSQGEDQEKEGGGLGTTAGQYILEKLGLMLN